MILSIIVELTVAWTYLCQIPVDFAGDEQLVGSVGLAGW